MRGGDYECLDSNSKSKKKRSERLRRSTHPSPLPPFSSSPALSYFFFFISFLFSADVRNKKMGWCGKLLKWKLTGGIENAQLDVEKENPMKIHLCVRIGVYACVYFFTGSGDNV